MPLMLLSLILSSWLLASDLRPDLSRPQQRGCTLTGSQQEWRTAVWADYKDEHAHDSAKPEGHTYTPEGQQRTHCWVILLSVRKDGKSASRDCFDWLKQMEKESKQR